MEKTVTCTGCNRPFKVIGTRGGMREVADGVTCPYCNEPNEVMWSPDGSYSTDPPKKSATPK